MKRNKDDYILLWGGIRGIWRVYRLETGFMDGWMSLIEHECSKTGEVYSGHLDERDGLECTNCYERIPDEVITLWKLHNADQMWRIEV